MKLKPFTVFCLLMAAFSALGLFVAAPYNALFGLVSLIVLALTVLYRRYMRKATLC